MHHFTAVLTGPQAYRTLRPYQACLRPFEERASPHPLRMRAQSLQLLQAVFGATSEALGEVDL